MSFAEPTWLLILPALALLAWQWPRLELKRPLRVLCLLLLTLALAHPQWPLLGPGVDLWVLTDRSDSAADLLGPRLPEWESLLRRNMGAQDHLHFVDFGEDANVRADEPGAVSEVQTHQTRIANALQLAVLQRDEKRATRFLLLTDGYSTEPLDGMTELLTNAAIPLDLRLVARSGGTDFQVDSIQAPSRVQAGEPFILDVYLRVDGVATASVPYQIERDGAVVARGRADFQNGAARVRLTDHLAKPGAAHFVARVLPDNDPLPGNNAAETWVESVAGPRILLVSAYPDDPVAKTLTAQGLTVDLETNPASLHVGRLTGARALIIDNVPAHKLPEEFLHAAEFFVRDQGGGLLMLGGKNSFGSGGYAGSPIDNVLPVSLELRQEQHKLAVAMVVALDRSGSMSAAVPGGGGTRIKMDLADAGAAEAIRQLGPQDAIAVFAVDTQSHLIVPLMNVSNQRDQMIDLVTHITSNGGGIYVYTALKDSWAELQKAQAGQKHIIIFADANDATQEIGNYQDILKQITDGGATVSVIGLGTSSDSGAAYLDDVARLGNGRIFYAADANDLPSVFTQDTVAVARSTFVDQATPLKPAAAWSELAAHNLTWLKSVDGYNLCYLQPHAAQAALTDDDDKAPLVAFWQRGAGRAAAVTFPLAGPFSDAARVWPAYGDFVTTLARWLMGPDTPEGIGVKARIDGDQLVVDLLYDQSWENELARNFPQAEYTQRGYNERQPLVWQRLQPGHFQTRARLAPGRPTVGVVSVGKYTLPFGPLAPGSNIEWLRDPAGPRALRTLSAVTGGEELVELRDAWRDTGQQRLRDLRPFLLIMLALALLAEATATRLGFLTHWAGLKVRLLFLQGSRPSALPPAKS